jgi:hypothetical protein
MKKIINFWVYAKDRGIEPLFAEHLQSAEVDTIAAIGHPDKGVACSGLIDFASNEGRKLFVFA